eukprot:1762419-Pyramimonas_sp.AAC.1
MEGSLFSPEALSRRGQRNTRRLEAAGTAAALRLTAEPLPATIRPRAYPRCVTKRCTPLAEQYAG